MNTTDPTSNQHRGALMISTDRASGTSLKRPSPELSNELPTNTKSLPDGHAVAKPITKFESDLMTRKEAAAYLGVSEMTLAIWKSTGRYRYSLRVYKIGRLAKYKRSDLDAFIRRRTIG
jgi:excisionase family DNA binding protein